MKKIITVAVGVVAAAALPFFSHQASALSCLPIDRYLKDVVGDDSIVILEGTSIDRIEETEYTAEVLQVKEVLQGYAESKIFVYHQKDPNWGYLCNNGPKAEGTTGIYLAMRDNPFGKYMVTQRLELTDDLVTTLKQNLKAKEIAGTLTSETTSTDRRNQIITTITDLLREIGILLKEYSYWKTN